MEQEVKSHGIEYVFWDFDLGMRRKTYLPVKKRGSVWAIETCDVFQVGSFCEYPCVVQRGLDG